MIFSEHIHILMGMNPFYFNSLSLSATLRITSLCTGNTSKIGTIFVQLIHFILLCGLIKTVVSPVFQ